MNNQKKYDMTTLAIFFPAVIALGLIPVLMRATLVATDLKETQLYFGGTEMDGLYYFSDVFSQCKAFAVVVFAIIMMAVALLCCMFLFKKAEKRSLAIVGASVVYVIMALISAAMSDYKDIAFYGDYERAEGFFTTACYFVIFLFTMYAFRDAQNFRPILFALFFCVGVNAVLGFFQFTGNNLETKEWFNNIIVERRYRGVIMPSTETSTAVYGALYHYNYVGSFAGMLVPLFTTLSLFEKKIGLRIGCIIADLLSIFMLLGSTARSGIVAVAAAAVVGIFIFFRVIIKHWKLSVSITAAAAAAVFGVNAAMDGAILRRIPTIFEDIVDFVVPAEEGASLFDNLPVKEIKQLDNGSVVFVTAKDELTLSFDNGWAEYHLTDSAGEEVEFTVDSEGNCQIQDDEGRFDGVTLMFYASEETYGEYYDFVFFTMPGNQSTALMFRLSGYNNIKLISVNTGEKIPIYNAEYIGFEGKEKVGSSRGYIWSRTFPLLKNCLVKGYGADTFTYYFPQGDYLAKFYCYDGIFDMTVDKVHNLYLQQLFSHGLIAFIAMMFIFIWYLVDCFRLYSLRKEYRMEQIYGASVMLAVVGYLTAGFFNDSCVSVAPVFWILLGVGFALNTINRRMDRGESTDLDEEENRSRKLSKKERQLSAQAEAASGVVLDRVRQARLEKEEEMEHLTADKMLELLQKIEKIEPTEDKTGDDGTDEED